MRNRDRGGIGDLFNPMIEKGKLPNIEPIKDYKQFYERKHKESTTYFELYVPSVLNNHLRDGLILDLGSGQQIRNILKNPSRKIIFSDISENAMSVAKMEGGGKSDSSFIVLDAANLPFKNNVFDSVLCKDILEHVPNDVKCVKEVCRCLKKRGRVGVWVPCTLLEEEIKNWGHLRSYSLEELKKLFKDFSLVYYSPNRTWKGHPFFSFLLNISLRIVVSILPWDKTSTYKIFQGFHVNKREYTLYLWEKYIDKTILKIMPRFGTCLIAVFGKNVE